ncbi:unnamed protein product [Mytilus edulis]|uniref:Integrase catalytic domain-containing protein n=1 Tax=Mytilus edulis TaxID=6550 RepID=A0A8S3S854_MYTED|nr:unnamed protein product [Mytilus edulis]
MPFGLCCAAQTFERLMETILAGLQWETCLVYIDDIIVFGKTLDGMLDNLRDVFARLKSAGLKLKAKKCTLCTTKKKRAETKDQYDTVNAITRFDDSNDKDDDSEHHDLSLIEIQKNDHDLKIVTKWVETDERPDYKDISDKGFFLRSLWNQWNNLELRDGLIYRRFEDPATKIVKMQAIIPLSERKKVLQFSHDDKCSAHLGIHKTLAKIRQSYYWPGLQNDVRTYVNGCDKCAKRKSPQKSKRAPMALVEANGPMERIATDILGELPETESGNTYILVVSDYYTKWTESFAMPNMEAKTVAKIIVEEVIVRFGVPHWIIQIKAGNLKDCLFQEMGCILDIKKTRTTPYHQNLMNQRDWDEYIPFVMMAYRASEHETTGQTPNSLMLGRELSTPLDIMYEMPPSVKDIPAHKWAWELKEKLEISHSFVRVDCGYRVKLQVIHVDRLKKKNKQTLRTESDNNTFVPLDTENDTAENDHIETPYVQDIAVHESTLPVEETEESNFSMAKTKTTPRMSEHWECVFCPSTFSKKDDRDKHLAMCAGARLFCKYDGCFYNTDKGKNLQRHVRNKHVDTKKEGYKSKELVDTSDSTESEEWERQDPGEVIKTNSGTESEESESKGTDKDDTKVTPVSEKNISDDLIKVTVDKENETTRKVVCRNDDPIAVSAVQVGRTIRQKTSPRLPGKRSEAEKRHIKPICTKGSDETVDIKVPFRKEEKTLCMIRLNF